MAKVVLVLIHGINSDGHAWEPMIDLLEGDPTLGQNVSIVNFEYATGKIELRPNRTFPSISAIATALATTVKESVPPQLPIIFAAHSQGGLVVQRYLVQQLDLGRGEDLRRVKRVLLFATPNSGSNYASMLRSLAWPSRPQCPRGGTQTDCRTCHRYATQALRARCACQIGVRYDRADPVRGVRRIVGQRSQVHVGDIRIPLHWFTSRGPLVDHSAGFPGIRGLSDSPSETAE